MRVRRADARAWTPRRTSRRISRGAGGSAIDARTTRHDGYAKSQHARPRIEPAFGWLKTIAWIRKVKLRGLAEGRLAVRLRERRVQSDPVAEAAAAARVMRRRVSSPSGRDETPARRVAGRSAAAILCFEHVTEIRSSSAVFQ